MGAPKGNKFALGLSTSGRPPKFEHKEDMLTLIVDYFNETELKELTITGLVLFLGFDGRQSFYDYEKKKEFSYIIKRARAVIENKYETMLTENNATGSIFALKNMGWKDKQDLDHTTKGESMKPPVININMPDDKK